MNKFSSSLVYKKTSDSLNAIRQRTQEPLREYLDQFNILAMQIQDLDPTLELHSINRGLQADPFAHSLAINPSRSLVEFEERAMGYMNMEEVQETRKAEG